MALCQLMPAEPEPAGLLCLLELQHARRAARVDEHGDLVTLEEQDRSRWDREEIDRALGNLERAASLRPTGAGGGGPYELQAGIAACHARAATPSATDWQRIAALYGELASLQPSPVVELNRAVAVAMAEGPEAGLGIAEALATGGLRDYHLAHATRADLLRRLGRTEEAAAAYRRALELTTGQPERRFLARRLGELAALPG